MTQDELYAMMENDNKEEQADFSFLVDTVRARLGESSKDYTDTQIVSALGDAMVKSGYRPEGVNRKRAREVHFGS